jgi:hypothetical protein
MMASSKTDATGALQHEDEPSCSNANLFDDPVIHPETSLVKSGMYIPFSCIVLQHHASKI